MEQFVAVPVPQNVKEAVEMRQLVPHEHFEQYTVECMPDVPATQAVEENQEFAQTLPHERISERIVEEIVDVLVPQSQQKILERTSRVHHRANHQRTLPQFQVHFVDAVKSITQERVH